jgi:hypothetical protein
LDTSPVHSGGREVEHDDHACERLAATFAWTYRPSADNNQRSQTVMSAFRDLMSRLLLSPESGSR